jgi:hypothetical protein
VVASYDDGIPKFEDVMSNVKENKEQAISLYRLRIEFLKDRKITNKPI